LILREKKKTKVYELSRALKLKEPELFSILETLGIEVSTKFTPLEEIDVDRVKAWCNQHQGPDVVEKRVASGVLRRRVKDVPESADISSAKALSPDEVDEVEPVSESDEPDFVEAEPTEPAEVFTSEVKTRERDALESDTAAAEVTQDTESLQVAPAEEHSAEDERSVPGEVPLAPTEAELPTPESSETPASRVEMEVAEVLPQSAVADSLSPDTKPDSAIPASAGLPESKVSESEVEDTEAARAAAIMTERKPKSGRTGARGARVIGRVALGELGLQASVRPARDKFKKTDGEPSVVAPVAPPVEVVQPGKETVEDRMVASKKGRKSRKKEGGGAAFANDDSRSRKASRRAVIKNLDFADDRGGKGRRRGLKKKSGQKTEITLPKLSKRVVKITDAISVGELARKMGIKAGEVIAKLMSLGNMVTINQMIDFETASLVAEEYGHTVENVAFDEDLVLDLVEDKPEDLVSRPPVVTIMGHVDHGKTSLLDAIRLTKVADGEAGGITQHIGAYMVSLPRGDISFVDTPGHEAFTSMRSRGAGVTDIVILVVAADDGVMPTTIESINHAKAANVPIIVAINKIDKDNARPDEVRRQLSEYGLIAEEWGGQTIFVEVSAKQRLNLDTLLEMILLQAEMMELSANPDKAARGVVLESRLDRGKGPVATILVQDGTVKQGDLAVAGLYSGRVRALINDMGETVDSAGPSTPVEVLGLSGVPSAGDDFNIVKSEKQAKELTSNRQHKAREQEISKTSKISLEDLFEQMEEGAVEQLNVIVKGDVQGSVEAVSEALKKQATTKVKVEVVHAAVGGVKEADVMLAAASRAIIVAFNVRPDLKAQHLAEHEHVDIRLYSVIYDLIEDLRMAMEGLLAPEVREVYLGRAEVRQAFMVSKVGMIAGCRVVDGKVKRNAQVRLLRDDVVIVEGRISSLKRFKDDAKEVATGFECGIGIENYNDIKPGDVIEAFVMEEVAAKL